MYCLQDAVATGLTRFCNTAPNFPLFSGSSRDKLIVRLLTLPSGEVLRSTTGGCGVVPGTMLANGTGIISMARSDSSAEVGIDKGRAEFGGA